MSGWTYRIPLSDLPIHLNMLKGWTICSPFEAMMEFVNEAKDVNGMVKGLSDKVDVALKGHEAIFAQLHAMTTAITQLNTNVTNLKSIVSKLLEKVESNHAEVMKKLEDVLEEVVEIPSSPKP